MELEYIAEVPDFKPDVDPQILAGANPAQVYACNKLSSQEKGVRWACETSLRAYNLAVQLDRSKSNVGKQVLSWLAQLALIVVAYYLGVKTK